MEKVINILLSLFGDFILANFYLYMWNNIINRKHNKKYFTMITIITLILNIPSYFLQNPLRIIIVSLLLFVVTYYYFSKNIKTSLFLVIFTQALLCVIEFSFAIILSMFYKGDIQVVAQKPAIYLILNLYILFISFIINKSKCLNKLFNIIKFSQDNELVIYSIIIIITLIISTAESYMELPSTIVLIVNSIIAMTFIIIVLNSTKTNDKYYKINSKYETSINSLKEYEAMIDRFRVSNHENKNQLLTVRNMIKDNPDKAIEYIDTLVNHKFKDNEAIMYRTSKIPEGGLRATIYSKLCIMDKEKIKYTLDIANDVRTAELINIDDDLTLDICKILGVFLDNAIEAVKTLRKRQIDIEMYIMDGKLCIDITNNFKGNLDLEKIGSKKYSTKGANHGYGLSLVSQIIKEHSNVLENEKSINKNTFTQCLKIKM